MSPAAAGRRFIVECNWKMHKTRAEAAAWVRALKQAGPRLGDSLELVVCVPATLLALVAEEARGAPHLSPGAQNLHWQDAGAFTGEVSAPMLADAGARYCFVGHSERRREFGETDELANLKAKAALRAGIAPILCTGEEQAARRRGLTRNTLERQLTVGLEGFTPEQLAASVLLYEPVWAVGTGENASAEQADEAHHFIRQHLRERFPAEAAAAARIIYGGSVNPQNIDGLLRISDLDGVGIGKACLEVESYLAIAEACRSRL